MNEKKILFEMSWNELDVLFTRGGNSALAPILRSKGIPVNDNLVPTNGVFYYNDRQAIRVFCWEGFENAYLPEPTLPPAIDRSSFLDQEPIRSIELEEDE